MTETAPRHFASDFAKLTSAIESAGAIVTHTDGFQSIDPSKVDARTLSAYSALMRTGYANGWLA